MFFSLALVNKCLKFYKISFMEICDRYDVSKMADKAVKICFFGNKVIRIIKITLSKMNIF